MASAITPWPIAWVITLNGGHRLEAASFGFLVVIIANRTFGGWPTACGDPTMTTAMLDRLTRHCDIVKTGNDSLRLTHRNGVHEYPGGRALHAGCAYGRAALALRPVAVAEWGSFAR